MSILPRLFFDAEDQRDLHVPPAPVLQRTPSGIYDQLIEGLSQLKMSRPVPGCGVFAFTACSPGEGVTFVVRSLAFDLQRIAGEKILIAEAGRMTKLSPAELKDIKSQIQEVTPGVFELSERREDRMAEPGGTNYEAALHCFRKEFGYVLIDCPPLRKGSDTMSLAPSTDGLLLVVAAGKTKRTKIEQAQKLIERSSGRLLGCILNKRTYPVPNFLYKQL